MARPRNRPFCDSGSPKEDGAELAEENSGGRRAVSATLGEGRTLAIPLVDLIELVERRTDYSDGGSEYRGGLWGL